MHKYIAYYLIFTWVVSIPMIYLFVTPDFVESQISRILVTIFLTVCMGGALREMYREINNTELE